MEKNMTEDVKLIPDLKEWKKWNGDSFSIEDWIVSEGNISFAIGYSFIFWPDFIEHEDCIILRDRFQIANFEAWKQTEYIQNYAQIEVVLNHMHILDLFGTDEKKEEISSEQIRFLGERICDMYQTKLSVLFPDREFVFVFNGSEVLEALDEYELTFYQTKNIDCPIPPQNNR